MAAEDRFGADDLALIAYRLPGKAPLRLAPATVGRDWIDATTDRFARHCLPLLMANQAGWFILNDRPLRVTRGGGRRVSRSRSWLAIPAQPIPRARRSAISGTAC